MVSTRFFLFILIRNPLKIIVLVVINCLIRIITESNSILSLLPDILQNCYPDPGADFTIRVWSSILRFISLARFCGNCSDNWFLHMNIWNRAVRIKPSLLFSFRFYILHNQKKTIANKNM